MFRGLKVFLSVCIVVGVAALVLPRLKAMNDRLNAEADEYYGYGWRVYDGVTALPPATDAPVPCCVLERQPALKAFAAMVPLELCQPGHIAMYLEHLYETNEPTDGCSGSERSQAADAECWPVETHECFRIVGEYLAKDRQRRNQESQTQDGGAR